MKIILSSAPRSKSRDTEVYYYYFNDTSTLQGYLMAVVDKINMNMKHQWDGTDTGRDQNRLNGTFSTTNPRSYIFPEFEPGPLCREARDQPS